MTQIQEGHQGEIFTRESLLGAIAENEGAETAQFADEVPPSNQAPQQPIRQDVKQNPEPASQEQPAQNVEQPQQPEMETYEEPAPLELGDTFQIPQEQYQPYQQPQISEAQIDALVEQKLAAKLNQKQQAAEEAGEKKPESLTREEMQKIINETLQYRDYMAQQEAQKQQIVNTYETNLTAKLRNAGVDIDNDVMLQKYVISSFKDLIQEGRAYRGGELTPVDYMKLCNYHTKMIEKDLNMKRPQQPRKGNLSMSNTGQPTSNQQPTQQQASYANKTEEQIHKEAAELIKKQGKLRPSDAIKYQRALMKAQGLNKIRF